MVYPYSEKMRLSVQTVDTADNIIGSTRRSQLSEKPYNFRVVHGLLVNRGHLLMQQLPADHPRHPLSWGSSVAGYVLDKEDCLSSLKRKAHEELSLSDFMVKKSLKFSMPDFRGSKFVYLYHLGMVDDSTLHQLAPNQAEIKGLAWFRIDDLVSVENRPVRVTPTFENILKYIPELLKS